MKTILRLSILLFIVFAACKKNNNKPAVSMTVIIDSDTAWTTTNVVTDHTNNTTVFISGSNSATNEKISLAITNFVEAKKAYYIDYRGPGGNIYGNTGSYTQASNLYDAKSGNIYVTSVTGNAINGSFDFYFDQKHISGFFTAAKN